MRNIFAFSILIILGAGSSAFKLPSELSGPPFSGLWQGVTGDETSIFIEFSPEGYYRLRVGEHKLTDNVEHWGEVRYEWDKQKDHYLITIFGEKEPELTTRLEAVMMKGKLLRLNIFTEDGTFASSILLRKV